MRDTEKLVRQLSLISYLLAERQLVTAPEIRSDVEGYGVMQEDVFARRFYADRAELEAVGIVLEVEEGQDRLADPERYSAPIESSERRSRISELLLELLDSALRRVPLTDADLAAATATDGRTVARWITRRVAPTSAQTALLGQLLAVVYLLEIIAKPEAIQAWLNSGVAALDGRRPLETLASGGYRLVAAAARDVIDPSA